MIVNGGSKKRPKKTAEKIAEITMKAGERCATDSSKSNAQKPERTAKTRGNTMTAACPHDRTCFAATDTIKPVVGVGGTAVRQ
jgi:hypothetical protein